MRSLTLICVLLCVRTAGAHDVPVNPGACTFDPFELTAPAAGLSAAVAAPMAGDAMRVVYSVATATAQFQQQTVAPRAFTIGGVTGTIAFPQAWNAGLAANGELHADQVTLDVVLGGARATVAVRLTTAVAVAGEAVVTGAPMADDGRFTLAGAIPAGLLPPPLAGAATAVRLACRVTPAAPDQDQFAPAPDLTSLAGVLSSGAGKLRGTLQGAGLAAASFTGGPAILHLEADGAPLTTVQFPDGFTAQGARLLVARSAGGGEVTLRFGKGRARLLATLPGMAMPATATGTAEVEAILVAGPTAVRGGRPFRARGGALRAGS